MLFDIKRKVVWLLFMIIAADFVFSCTLLVKLTLLLET